MPRRGGAPDRVRSGGRDGDPRGLRLLRRLGDRHPDLEDAVAVGRRDVALLHALGQRQGAGEAPVAHLVPDVALVLAPVVDPALGADPQDAVGDGQLHVLRRVDRADDRGLVDVVRQRELDEDPIDGRVGIEFGDEREQVAGGALPRAEVMPLARRGVLGALVAFASFGSIMLATRIDDVGRAAVLRETSTVFAALVGWLILGEKVGPVRAILMALIAAGAKVVLADINAELLNERSEALGASAHGVVTNVCDEAAAQAAVNAAVEHFGGLHGLVNCAGVASGEKVLGRQGPHGLESFSRVIGLNLIGSFNMLRLAAEAMSRSEPDAQGNRGVIINTASIAAYDGQIGQAAYAASKGGVVAMTLPAARELARHGIRVMTIAPGVFETPMMAAMTQEVRDSLAAGVPFPPRLGRANEYAALVRHIIENDMLNGEVIRLDGALRMAAK